MAFDLMESRRRILMNTPHVELASGDIATFSTDMAVPLKSCVVTINLVQAGTGTPSPDNVRPISGWTGCQVWDESTHNTAASPRITVSWQTEAGTVYGGTLDVLTRKLTVDKWGIDLGTLTWSNNNITKHIYQAGRSRNPAWARLSSGQTAKAICSQYVLTNSSASGVGATDYSIALGTGSSSNIYVRDSTYGDAAEFQSAASGIQLVYKLATQIEYTLTPQQVSTLKGVNNIWADCGPVNIKYWTH